jgi:DNA invertase Pin-like site-specific DNA recombinase
VTASLVAYYRVSTKRQGRSGLGLEAQRADVERHAAAVGGTIMASYVEVETGKRDDLANRPQLRRAIAHAKRAKAVLVIAKLDRLTRSVYVTALLLREAVDFVCCDQPNANRLTIQILAAVAEDEARRISERTRAALVAYKARGGSLGAARPASRNLTAAARRLGNERAAVANARAAAAAYEDLFDELRSLRAIQLSLRQIAGRLNEQGHRLRRGGSWSASQVSRVLAMIDRGSAEPKRPNRRVASAWRVRLLCSRRRLNDRTDRRKPHVA